MTYEEILDSLVQHCFIALENRNFDFSSQVFLNYSLLDNDVNAKKRFINKKIKRLKKELGKLTGDLAVSVDDIYSKKIDFPDYDNFYDMAHKCLEESLKEYIEWTISFPELGKDSYRFEGQENYVSEKPVQEYNSLENWIQAVGTCLNINLIEYHLSLYDENMDSTITEDFYSMGKASELIKFGNGRKLNLKERYFLLDGLMGIDSIIRKLTIKNEEKEKLLAYVLNCNPKNAQQILNGTYDARLREMEIVEYLKSVKKE